MKKTFSIRYKFLAVTTLLLLFCVASYLAIATRVFKGDKTELVFDYNKSLVTNLSSDIETIFNLVSDKMKLVAYFFSEKSHKDLIKDLLDNSSEIVFVGGSDTFEKMDREFHVNREFLSTYGLKEDFFSVQLNEVKKTPFKKIQSQGDWIWNATVPNGPALIGFGKNVVAEAADGSPIRQYAVIAFVKADKILKSLSQSQMNEVVVANKDGEVLVHRDPEILYSGKDEKLDKIIQQALESQLRVGVQNYREGKDEILGAYAKGFGSKVIVLSRVAGSEAFAVVDRFIYRSIVFALIVVTMAFIAAILFSRSLTKPLQALISGMKQVADGDLSTQISIRTKDEILLLAESFNSMIRDLQHSRQELEEINRELENKVRERTLQLERQNQAVKSAQEALLKSTRLAAVGEIAGRAAHEVLNPLTSILSRLEKVKKRLNESKLEEIEVLKEITKSWQDDVDQGGFEKLIANWQAPSQVQPGVSLWDEDLQNLQAIESHVQNDRKSLIEDTEFLMREGQRINRIVQSMRTLSVVSGEKRLFSMADLVQESIHIMADLASKYDIKIDFVNDCGQVQVLIDEDEFIQSLTNLLRNSIQAIQEKKLTQAANHSGVIRLQLTTTAEKLNLIIEDNGMGISEENQKRLFESHFSTKSKNEGTGLGLNISRRFIRAYGGDIYLKNSKAGSGCEFVLSLPQASAHEKKVSA